MEQQKYFSIIKSRCNDTSKYGVKLQNQIMRFLILALFTVVLVSACKKDTTGKIRDGKYVGTFSRSNPLSNTGSSNVTLIFDGNRFSGSSDITNYPAICKGTFNAGSSKMEVVNECMFTANFDWTYIFKGEYDYEVEGNELRIFKRYPNTDDIDSYNLTRVK